MKKILAITISLSFILILNSCVEYYEIDIKDTSKENIKPKKVLLFVDCSASMKGFFNKNEASSLLGNISSDLRESNIPIELYKFNANSDSISNDINIFLESLNGNTFNCVQNIFSAPFEAITQKLKKDEIAIIVTDAVISTSGTEYTIIQESAFIKDAIAKDQKNNDNNFGIFQYHFGYNGQYYPQPSDKPISTGDVKRNFFLFSLANSQYNSFLNEMIISRNQPNNYQYFTQAYNDFIQLEILDEPTIVANNKFSILMSIDKDAVNIKLQDLKNQLEFFQGEDILKGISFEVRNSKEENKFIIDVDLSKVENLKLEGKYGIRLKEKTKVKSNISSLNYDVPAEPTKNEDIDHSKTFRLDIILDALAYRYQESYLYEDEFSIVSSNKSSSFSWFYTPILGKQSNTKWIDKIYSQIFWLWFIIPLIFTAFFYFSKRYDNNSFKAKKIWFAFMGSSMILTLLITSGVSFNGSGELMPSLTHGILNMIASLIPFIISTFIFKQFNQNLTDTPF